MKSIALNFILIYPPTHSLTPQYKFFLLPLTQMHMYAQFKKCCKKFMWNVPYNFTKNTYERCAQNQNTLRQNVALQICLRYERESPWSSTLYMYLI